MQLTDGILAFFFIDLDFEYLCFLFDEIIDLQFECLALVIFLFDHFEEFMIFLSEKGYFMEELLVFFYFFLLAGAD